MLCLCFFFFSSRRRHTRSLRDWSSDVCSSDLNYADARNPNNFRRERLRRRGAATRERTAIGDFDLHFVQRKLGAEFAEEILRSALQFLRSRADHSNGGNLIPRRAKISSKRGFQRRDG